MRQFDRATGALIKTFTLPSNLNVANLSPVGQTEIDNNTVGRVANKGMEGLAITPDGKTLVGIMRAQLEQDTGQNVLRIVTIDVATGVTYEYGYALTDGSGVSDIVAIKDHQFLVDERDGNGLGDGSKAKAKKIYQIDISGAVDITDMSGAAAAANVVTKNATPFLDLVTALSSKLGLTTSQVPAKIEGIALLTGFLGLGGMLRVRRRTGGERPGPGGLSTKSRPGVQLARFPLTSPAQRREAEAPYRATSRA